MLKEQDSVGLDEVNHQQAKNERTKAPTLKNALQPEATKEDTAHGVGEITTQQTDIQLKTSPATDAEERDTTATNVTPRG